MFGVSYYLEFPLLFTFLVQPSFWLGSYKAARKKELQMEAIGQQNIEIYCFALNSAGTNP